MTSGIQWRRSLLAAGVTEDELRRWLRAGSLVPLRRGAYATGLPPRPEDQHLLQALAAARELAPDAVLSHVSAAVLHGLDVWGVSLDRVHVTRHRRSGVRIGRQIHVHAATLAPHEIVSLHGLRVTSLARTVADNARSLPMPPAVVIADSALHTGTVTHAELVDALGERRPGAAAARRILTFADGRADNPGESLSRVQMRLAGLPPPDLQHTVLTRGGRFVGTVDFWWPGVVGEFDGRVKYGRLLEPGQEPGDVVWKEKVREDAIRAEDHAVVRWIWADLTNFDPVAAMLRERIGRGHRR
ncbi:type IV toxin-antitoxin system AbiEi family antitoxin domain-containing protein [Pseudonocardia sp. GCM10023141]|uniref:type IV toxin-antitoxin system AbiEi family antitoxin domain-containing protein n=1 Tax=Pseudonocardia sp. GCM10023141 TaxID=3252653 RepID=UPI0036181523